ncbi:hypothetical protein Ancab_015423 [Ancistrocladus abbreviatus]
MFDPVQDRKNDAYKLVLELVKHFLKASGFIINSYEDLEPGAFMALMQNEEGIPPVYPVGPLVGTGSEFGTAGSDQCLPWLDEQPSGSVLFVSFGSAGTLSHEQTTELALGLEMSGQRFLWVFKVPNDKAVNATYFYRSVDNDPSQYLPDGFLERTKTLGLVVPSWVPQVQILGHGSTGGFLSHCGWNSKVLIMGYR